MTYWDRSAAVAAEHRVAAREARGASASNGPRLPPGCCPPAEGGRQIQRGRRRQWHQGDRRAHVPGRELVSSTERKPMTNAITAPAAEIRPFHVEVPEDAVADLRRRLAATRWPTMALVTDRSQGVQLATIQELA